MYNYFKNALTQYRQAGKMTEFTSLLGEYLCAFHEMRFVRIAQREAERGGKLAYLDELARVSEDGFPRLIRLQTKKEGTPPKVAQLRGPVAMEGQGVVGMNPLAPDHFLETKMKYELLKRFVQNVQKSRNCDRFSY